VLAVLALAAAGASSAHAQTTPAASTGVALLSRFDFHVSMEHLFSDERRFVWDANFGGELDLIDYQRGRATFVAKYQTILGSEFRAFDPTQGNYILEGSASARAGSAEAAAVFHHESRHLSDRPKRGAIDWNMVGGRLAGSSSGRRTALRGHVDVRGVVQKTFVDYQWEVASDGGARIAIRPRMAALASGGFRILGVDGSRDRGNQYGFRAEGGVRFDGRAAALDLFVALERRIDPHQLEFSTVRWMTMGFRISSPGASRMP
jgi:hypothetical protein